MKKSNIIILSTIGLVFLMNIWILIDAKHKFKDVLNSQQTESPSLNITEIKLEDFSHIVLTEDIKLNIEKGDINRLTFSKNDKIKQEIRNDTLFLSGTTASLEYKNISSLELKEEARVFNSGNFSANYLLINSFEDSKVILKEVSINKLDIYTKDESKIVVQGSNIDTTNILAMDNSKIKINGNLEIVRGEVKNNSKVAITGANNTQFSKSDNGTVKMN